MMNGVTVPVPGKMAFCAVALLYLVGTLYSETKPNTQVIKPDLNPDFLEKRYAPYKGQESVRLYFIVHNLGLNESQTREIISLLPKEVAISLSPYVTYSKDFLDMLQKKGHHILWVQPTEFYRQSTLVEDPLRLSRSKTPEQNAASVDAVLAKMPSVVAGIITDEATPVVHDKNVMDVLMPKLKNKKLPFVHNEMS
ncbi:MAG: divergent polysaccharide deacetylase family protein, partial [Alphaproteobacteria bacterium]|nr:divergent polysaccharide deacetylase family protein [Alphaproteobacteria bacterium]